MLAKEAVSCTLVTGELKGPAGVFPQQARAICSPTGADRAGAGHRLRESPITGKAG